MIKFGYARVSTEKQDLEIQITELKRHGCEEVIDEKISGSVEYDKRPKFSEILKRLRKHDELIVHRLDRLGRNLNDMKTLLDNLKSQGITFRAIAQDIVVVPEEAEESGKFSFEQKMTKITKSFFLDVLGLFAENEREIIKERVKEGIQAAIKNGRVWGKKPGLNEEALSKARAAKSLYSSNTHSNREIARMLNISPMTLYKYLKHEGIVFREQNGQRIKTHRANK